MSPEDSAGTYGGSMFRMIMLLLLLVVGVATWCRYQYKEM